MSSRRRVRRPGNLNPAPETPEILKTTREEDMAGRVVIRHISGTRMHQTDEVEADTLQSISAGRDEASNVRFASQREDMVSREHLRITRESAGSQSYLLSDLNSRNGTFL